MSATFKLNGKFAGLRNRRTTPGGILLNDFIVSVESNDIPWKQKNKFNILVTAWGDLAKNLKDFKSGETIEVEGIIESYKEINSLLALKLNNGGK